MSYAQAITSKHKQRRVVSTPEAIVHCKDSNNIDEIHNKKQLLIENGKIQCDKIITTKNLSYFWVPDN